MRMISQETLPHESPTRSEVEAPEAGGVARVIGDEALHAHRGVERVLGGVAEAAVLEERGAGVAREAGDEPPPSCTDLISGSK